MGFPNGGEGGGVPHLGKIPTFSRYFFWGASLSQSAPSNFAAKKFRHHSLKGLEQTNERATNDELNMLKLDSA